MINHRLDVFYDIASVIAHSFITYLPGSIELDDVIQDLVVDLFIKLRDNKFSTDNEAWVICQHRLFNMFREWDTTRKKEDRAREDIDGWNTGVRDVLDRLYEQSGETILVRVTGKDIAEAARNYGGYIRDINTHGYAELTRVQKIDGFLFVDGAITPKFLAGITRALVVLGTMPAMAIKIISVGLKCIRRGYERTEEDSMLLRNYRRRVGKDIRWQRLPGGDVVLRRGRFRLRAERT